MKIGLTTSVIQRGKTGIAEYVFSLVRHFEEYAPEHQFVLFVLEEDLPLFDFAKNFVQLVPVPEKIRPPLRDIFWHQAILPGLAAAHGLDVIHVPSYRRLLWRRPCATVGTVHDLAAFKVAKKYDWLRMIYGRVVARWLAQRQHEIITISRNTAQDIKHFWKLPDSQMTVIHHGIDLNRFYPVAPEVAKSAAAQQFGLREPFFLYVARLEHPAKNHLRLIQAFENFKKQTDSSWELVFAGSDWHGAEHIHEAINHSPFRDDIRCLGFVPDVELPLLYRAAEVFTFPSLYEGFGFPPLEAMASGCPVVCSTRGSLGEVVGDAAVTIDPENVDELTAQMTRLATDKNLRMNLRAAGLKRAQEFNWPRTAAQTMAVYERAAARNESRSWGASPQSTRVSPVYGDAGKCLK